MEIKPEHRKKYLNNFHKYIKHLHIRKFQGEKRSLGCIRKSPSFLIINHEKIPVLEIQSES